MVFTIPHEISMIISSDPENGATNLQDNGSYFEVKLEEGIRISREALNVSIKVEEASIWWTIPNVETGKNDILHVTGPNTSDVITTFDITIPQGLYDLNLLNLTIERQLKDAGAKTSPNSLITLLNNNSTQKVELDCNYSSVSIDFTHNDSISHLLGFEKQIYNASVNIAPNIAKFNDINYFIIHSDITSQGIRFNGTYTQSLTQVLIDVSPGNQILNRPYHPAKVDCSNLRGENKNILRFWLSDDKNRRVHTNGEYWTARLKIEWLQPFIVSETPH